jgi:RNA polymerase sigma-70 factor (ECF subfamily)
VAEVFETFERMEKAYMQRVYYHKAYYTLDCSDEIEHSVVFRVLSPEEIYERKLTKEQLHAAISMLPDKQAKRIYARYILGMSNVEIAKAEGVSKAAITYSIQRGMRELARRVKKF